MTDEPTCKTCGAKIIWIESETGKTVPLDARRHPIYVPVVFDDRGNGVEWRRLDNARITHFATCPQASQHSRSRKEPTT